MREVEDLLIVGVGVNRGHETTLDAEGVVKNLGHGRKAVSGARGIRDDVVGRGVVLVVVDAHDDRDVLALCGSGDDDLLGARSQVLAR